MLVLCGEDKMDFVGYRHRILPDSKKDRQTEKTNRQMDRSMDGGWIGRWVDRK